MPFGPPDRPSLALSLLAKQLRSNGIACDVFYFNVEFHCWLEDKYAALHIYNGTSHPFELLGEYIFSDLVFGAAKDEGYVTDILLKPTTKSIDVRRLQNSVDKAREIAPEFLEHCLAKTDWSAYDVVGFTSMFQQQLASLSLARRLKAAYPALRIVFGGSNCHGHMARGILESFPYIDAVCSGEGDDEFLELIRMPNIDSVSLRNFEFQRLGRPLPPTIITLVHGESKLQTAQKLVDLSQSPPPDFSDFFQKVKSYGAVYEFTPRLLFETSRGCWWGQKHHCTFCGLNTEFMEKGSTKLQNVYFLRLARQYGIESYWNILTGVPSESIADYQETPEIFSRLHHLSPPPGIGRIRIDRFSPYFFRSAEYGIKNLVPFRAYSFIYRGLTDLQIEEIAYYYTGEVPTQVEFSEISKILQPSVDEWQHCHAHSVLVSMNFGDGSIIFDTRPRESSRWSAYYIHGAEWAILKSLSEIRGEEAILREFSAWHLDGKSIVDLWLKNGLIIRSEGKLLSVVNEWRDGYSITPAQVAAINIVIDQQGSKNSAGDRFVCLPKLTSCNVATVESSE